MVDIFVTWMCVDDKESSSYFPSVKGKSDSKAIQDIYWRCVTVNVFTARVFNPDIEIIVFSNTYETPVIDSIALKDVFSQLRVKFITIPFLHQPPKNYYKYWKNQFFEFSIFDFAYKNLKLDDNDCFVIVDSDCITTAPLSDLFASIKKNGCITYVIPRREDEKVHDNSRIDLKNIFEKLQGAPLERMPEFHGGEFLGIKIDVLKQLMELFNPTWNALLDLCKRDLPKLNTEEHVLSYLYLRLGYTNGKGNAFIKRLWTDPTNVRNVSEGDESLPIWHLPAEKRYGFRLMFRRIKRSNFDLNAFSLDEFVRLQMALFQVPHLSIPRRVYFFAKKIAKKALQK